MHQQAGMGMELLLFLIVALFTSATVLFLVQSGILQVRAQGENAPILNLEFIPVAREGTLVIKEFQFCDDVDEQYRCVGEKDAFEIGEEVHFRFVVESSPYNGEVMLVENYRIKRSDGQVVLEVDEKNNYQFNLQSNKRAEDIYFKDYLLTEEGDATGTYTLELLIENPLLNKKVTLVKLFRIE